MTAELFFSFYELNKAGHHPVCMAIGAFWAVMTNVEYAALSIAFLSVDIDGLSYCLTSDHPLFLFVATQDVP